MSAAVTSRNTVTGAVVTAAVPAAAEAGIAALADGGNAFDAAVAAAMVETVWLPMKCGLAGDVVALVQAAGGPVQALLSIGPGPAALDDPGAPRLTPTGPASVGAPGAPAGYAWLAERGMLPLDRLVAPAIGMARRGVTWLPIAVTLTKEAEPLLRRWNGAMPFLPDGRLPAAGEALHLPRAADLLDAFAVERGALFHGAIGDALLARLGPAGGLLSAADLRAPAAEPEEPLRVVLAPGVELWATPHPTHGAVLANALAGALAEGMAPLDALHAARARFDARATGGTSVVTAADTLGNRVVLVHSNSFPQYGAGVVVDEFDLVLNNRPGRGFALDAPAGHWNAPRAGRRPATTLHAWHLRTGAASFWGGTPGGENQAGWNLQSILALLDNGGDPLDAVLRPRWGFAKDGGLMVEEDHPQAAALGGKPVPHLGLRSVEQVIADRPDGLSAAADPRTGALALAFGDAAALR
ncbi:hypothetical protein HL658_14195 [Azospirillum sp. RWY-5-1]|uniref:Gamma-glutamyltransferase n=1 Tax=Azospirillum oleiclasticum TaxID=2735135 RepID=A0ABX2TCW7_9PROT|nr:gamma-glutamyltransferase [Azospirillum oleiclasticum]NYZ13701.1 hypothetical protein [Azospirillum oleiclasticum]NYZ20973.1 hypothetical protein [Azospirillum oleiclasticum]